MSPSVSARFEGDSNDGVQEVAAHPRGPRICALLDGGYAVGRDTETRRRRVRTLAGRAQPPSAGSDDAEPDRDLRRLASVGDAELAEDVLDVGLYGPLADEQGLGDLRVCHPARQEPEDLEFARGEPGGGR